MQREYYKNGYCCKIELGHKSSRLVREIDCVSNEIKCVKKQGR